MTTIQGGMQRWPLRISSILDHAADVHSHREIVTRTVEGSLRRLDYAGLRERVRRCANALENIGVRPGQRVGTLAWNTHRHLELWYACGGMGAVYHTVNPRLFEEQIQWIVSDAEDSVLCVDLTFVPLAERIAAACPCVRQVVILTDRAHMPETALPNALCYEELLEAASAAFTWRDVDEESALGLCYTSGTTGRPKGVLYSQRSTVLHAMHVNTVDAFGLSSRDVVLPVVPMYHANAWSLPFAGPMTGAKLVLPGARLDGESLCQLMAAEGVTFTAGVPTVWSGVVDHLRATHGRLPALRRVVVGGSACPPALFDALERELDIEVLHAWGMTEMSPVGSFATVRASMEDLTPHELQTVRLKQGGPVFGVEMRVVDRAGAPLPCDGTSAGALRVRGFAVLRQYYKGAGGEILDRDGYFDTGDVATIDRHGYMHITDRAKDMIKSGGEWISSIELENAAVGHPAISEAAAIAVPHPKWGERPLLLAVCRAGWQLEGAELRAWLGNKLARWALPDEVRFVESLPHTATGKLDKASLRARYASASGGAAR
jgi:fatty-acyl-CoA synthase